MMIENKTNGDKKQVNKTVNQRSIEAFNQINKKNSIVFNLK